MELLRKVEWEEECGKGRLIYVYLINTNEYLVERADIVNGSYRNVREELMDRNTFVDFGKQVRSLIKYAERLEQLGLLRRYDSYCKFKNMLGGDGCVGF